MVSYDYKHNEANENNADGSDHANLSLNHGCEGHRRPGGDHACVPACQMCNPLSTLLLSQGPDAWSPATSSASRRTIMRIAVDNESGWIEDWRLDDARPFVAGLTQRLAGRQRYPDDPACSFLVGE